MLVLDDLHVLRSRECLSQLAFLLLHAPPTVRLVLSTRADPAVPLHLLRVRGQLVEIRVADLAFTEDEAAALLATHGVTLTRELVGTLCARTEGWGAGLRLAALSLKDREDPERFVERVRRRRPRRRRLPARGGPRSSAATPQALPPADVHRRPHLR